MPRPPWVARAIFRILTPGADRTFILSDLDERFARVYMEKGVAAARWWYRRQVILSLPVLLTGGMAELGRAFRTGELRRAVRLLRRRPQYALGVTGTLALGFASAIVLGGLAWQVWLEPLPLPDSERLVRVYELEPSDVLGQRERFPVSPPLLGELRDREWQHLTGFAGILPSGPEWIVDGEIRHLRGAFVSPGFFTVLGLQPIQGRAEFVGRDGNEVPEAVLTEDFWLRAFGGDPTAIGSTLNLAGVPHTIVGVVSQNGEYPEAVDLFTPLFWADHQLGDGFRGARYVEAVGRVASSSSLEVASAELTSFVEALGDSWPSHVGWSGEIVSLRKDLVRPFRPALRLLLGAGLAFLTLSIVNVLGLSAARVLEQSREAAVRIALGASRARLRRSALIEGAVLGLVGGAAGLILARLLIHASIRWLPESLPRTAGLGLSPMEAAGWLALATCGGSLVTALARQLVPTNQTPISGVRVSQRPVGGWSLVIGQFAITTLLIGAGTLVLERSVDLADRDLGFTAENIWTGLVVLPATTDPTWEERRDTWTALLRELRERGYDAAISTNVPMSGSNNRFDYRRFPEDDQKFGQYSIVSPEYFAVMDIPVVEGRTFESGEVRPAVVISRALAEEAYPGESPVGRSLYVLEQEREIVGVVESTTHFGPDQPPTPMMYASYEAENWSYTHLVVAGNEGALRAIPSALERAAPGAAPPSAFPYRRHLSEWFRPLRIQLGIVGALAFVGSLLAALGLYSAIAFQVRGRLHELGIRKALGATRSSIVKGVVGRGAVTAGAGLVVGIALWWLGRGVLMEALGASGALSTTSLGVTVLAIMGLAVVAVAIPARRAAAADPLESFRAE